MNRIAALTLAGIVALGTVACPTASSSHSQATVPVAYVAWHEPEPTPATKCEEDEPCWNCQTMGNRICGPTVAAQAPAIATPAPIASPSPVPTVVPITTIVIPTLAPSATPTPSSVACSTR